MTPASTRPDARTLVHKIWGTVPDLFITFGELFLLEDAIPTPPEIFFIPS